MTKRFCKNGLGKTNYDKVLEKLAEYTKEIIEAKNNYILKMTKNLADKNTAPKMYWIILKRKLYNKKTSTIPPQVVNGKFVSNFCEKSNIFTNFYASIWTPIDYESCLPSFPYRTGIRINSFHVTENDIKHV